MQHSVFHHITGSKTAQQVEEAQIQNHMQHEYSPQQAHGPTNTGLGKHCVIPPIQESKTMNNGIAVISAVFAMTSASNEISTQ